MNHKQVIELWPSVREMSQDIDETVGAIKMWKVRESIPANKWVKVIEAAQDRDIHLTYQMLAKAIAA